MKAYLSYVRRPNHLMIGTERKPDSFGMFEINSLEDLKTIKKNLEVAGKTCKEDK